MKSSQGGWQLQFATKLNNSLEKGRNKLPLGNEKSIIIITLLYVCIYQIGLIKTIIHMKLLHEDFNDFFADENHNRDGVVQTFCQGCKKEIDVKYKALSKVPKKFWYKYSYYCSFDFFIYGKTYTVELTPNDLKSNFVSLQPSSDPMKIKREDLLPIGAENKEEDFRLMISQQMHYRNLLFRYNHFKERKKIDGFTENLIFHSTLSISGGRLTLSHQDVAIFLLKKLDLKCKDCLEEEILRQTYGGYVCENCNKILDEVMKYCPDCGGKSKMINYCYKCQKTVLTNHCTICGSKIFKKSYIR